MTIASRSVTPLASGNCVHSLCSQHPAPLLRQAARLADATGDNAVVREYLGLPEADPGVPPVPLIHGQPTAPATAPAAYTAQPSGKQKCWLRPIST